jgi:phosphotransferase system  glucose/maltose/N-acetylglucosamine-specific IIC component
MTESKEDIIENFELCDSPKWLLYILITISGIILCILLYYIIKRFTKKKGRKKGNKKGNKK